MARIFISYRRTDAGGQSAKLVATLRAICITPSAKLVPAVRTTRPICIAAFGKLEATIKAARPMWIRGRQRQIGGYIALHSLRNCCVMPSYTSHLDTIKAVLEFLRDPLPGFISRATKNTANTGMRFTSMPNCLR